MNDMNTKDLENFAQEAAPQTCVSTVRTIVKNVSSQLLEVLEEATHVPNFQEHHDNDKDFLDELSKVGDYLSSS